ncbi:flagellar basal body-associated protein FliL [Thiohalobacter thiocyanaticus]|uniref:Flagellar protein FliL n=1 Tax=Thiohalobacter thiocyanaticus TaxID=585455 RepID=A0A1Z4VQH7_9GAMM|nr:flagellar basal body-associated FliL family protein [Thiohalobacter thiocyanaticus]BAZ93881.1 flagellar basal body-associated protein FliL [Thiohalobacter thiocyanaticus]
MAEEDLDLDVDTAEAESGGGLKIVIIAAVVVLLLSSAVLAGLYFMGMLGGSESAAGQPAAAAEGAAAETAAPATSGGPLIYQPLEPPFVVNFGREADVRFMQITIQVADRDPAVIERIKEHNPAIRNGLVMLFSSQDPEVLNTREGKEQLRQDALEEVRSVLEQMTGRGRLENLYFTSFVMQ